MSVAVKGTPNSAASTSVTIPTHAAGDLIVLFAYNNASTGTPTKPTASGTVPAWVDIDNNTGGSLNASRTAYFVATAANHTSGTWTGATGMVAVVLQGQSTSPIGGHAESGSTGSGTASAPAVTLSETDGTSAILEFYGHRTVTAWSAAPTGYTRQTSVATSVCCNTKDSTTSDGAIAQSATTSSNAGYRGATVEVRAPRPKTETVFDDFLTQDAVKWTGYGTGVAVVNGKAQLTPPGGGVELDLSTSSHLTLTGSYVLANVSGYVNAGTTNYCSFGFYCGNSSEIIWISQDGLIHFYENANGTISDVTATYNAATHAWWRVHESGGTIFWDTSTNGITWTNRTSKAIGAGVDLTTGVIRCDAQSADSASLVINFDNVNMPPPVGELISVPQAVKRAANW